MKISRGMKEGSPDSILTIVAGIMDACTGNPNATGLTTEITALTTAHGVLSTARAAQLALQQQAQAATDATNSAVTGVAAAFETLAAHTETKAGMTAEIAHGMGFEVYQPGKSAALGPLPAPANLVATMGDQIGSIDIGLNRVHGASSYVFHKTQTPNTPDSWQHAAISSKSSCTISGLTSGQHYWFRAAAIGAAGQGPWSDNASQLAT